jgi:hypothetical protein
MDSGVVMAVLTTHRQRCSKALSDSVPKRNVVKIKNKATQRFALDE